MKIIILSVCVCLVFGFPTEILPPVGILHIQNDAHCSRQIEHSNVHSLKSAPNYLNMATLQRDSHTREYTFTELNAMDYNDLINLLVTLEWWEIDGLFEFSDGSYEFYSDTLRMQALFDAVEERGNLYTPDDALGIDVLVEVIRSGFYLAFYYEELNFLREPEFMDNTIPGMDAICSNPNFGMETESQTIVVSAFGYYQSIGISSIFSLLASTTIFEEFNYNFENYITEWDKGNAIYSLGNGTRYSLYSAHYNSWNNGSNHPEGTIYYGEIDPLFNSIAQIGLYGIITDDNEWLINNTVWWNAMVGQFVEGNSPVQFLTDVVELYGEWTAPSLEAVEMLCYLYDCEYADGTPIDEDGIIESVHDWLLPNRTTFDDETIIFKTGDNVTPEKVETLYWAMKEVKAQFHRISLNDIPLEQGNADDSLIAVIYNSPADYQYNNFLYGLGTNNGGMYIESWGTFFTYERTPQESIYTLEDLFRHEFTHYLQGRYLEPGMWWQHPIYDNERLTWFDEGSAEFMAGSSRLNGVQTRRTMVENIAWNESDRMTLAEVVNAQYGNWEFYTYGFAFFDYMYKNRMEMYLDMINHIKAGNGDAFDELMNEIANDEQLNNDFQAHMDELKENQNSYSDPVTGSAYFAEIDNMDQDNLILEIESVSGIENTSTIYFESLDHSLFLVSGTLPIEMVSEPETAWIAANEYLNDVLMSLSTLEWNGYETVNSWFTDAEQNDNAEWTYQLNFQGKLTLDLLAGDMNYDGNINVLDVVMMVNMILDNEISDMVSDMNNDGFLNVLDVVLVVNIILGN